MRDVIDQCRAAEVPLFVKLLGASVVASGREVRFDDAHAGDWAEWPQAIRVRGMPIAASVGEEIEPAVNTRHDLEVVLAKVASGAEAGLPPDELTERRRRAALKAWATRRARYREED